MAIILLIIGFILLIKSADYFVDGCSNLASSLGIPTLIIGLTVVAFGTSAPELAVSAIASIQGNSSISVGNVIGSNICNILLILGFCGLFGEVKTEEKIIKRDYLYLLLSSILIFILTAFSFIKHSSTSSITRPNGLILLCFLGIYIYLLLKEAKNNNKEENKKEKFAFKNIIIIILGLIGIIIGGQLVVNSAQKIASTLGVSDHLIALTIIAIGTSLPELVTSIIATKKGQTNIAIGNVIGSNIFNSLLILGVASIIRPLTVTFESFVDIIIMNLCAIIVYLFMLKNRRIGNKKGIIMLILYTLYTIYIILR